jgi:predicted RNA binding protein YcfA (HicA-like mRNA interferase family)
MGIEYAHLHSLSAREIMAALIRDGFYLRSSGGSNGSHQRFQHADGRRVTVSFHKPSDTFAPKTLKSIITQAGWTEEDLTRLKLIRHSA